MLQSMGSQSWTGLNDSTELNTLKKKIKYENIRKSSPGRKHWIGTQKRQFNSQEKVEMSTSHMTGQHELQNTQTVKGKVITEINLRGSE